jgi:hypothetical protein
MAKRPRVSKSKDKPLPPGVYTGLTIKRLIPVLGTNKFIVEWDWSTAKKVDRPTVPDEGHQRYFVHCDKLSIYTTMGADNIHHASNKATKLWGPYWSKITTDQGYGKGNVWYPVKDFGELLSTLQI